MKIISPSNTAKAQKFFNDKVLDSKLFNKVVYNPAVKDPAKFAAKMALVSALTKDAVGCYYYVTQSLDNEKIPEEKRKFVAALDLMNGILNVALQFTVGMWIDKKAPKWFENTVGKKLDTDETVSLAKNIYNKLEKAKIIKEGKLADVENYLRESVLGPSGKATKWLKVGFSAAAVLVATQVITKRVIVPFLSTPLASWYKENFMDNKKGKASVVQPQQAKQVAPESSAQDKQNTACFQDRKTMDQFIKR